MTKRDGDMLFDRASADPELGGDIGVRQAVDLVAAKHAHRAFGRAGEGGGELRDPLSPGDRIEGRRRIVDRLAPRGHPGRRRRRYRRRRLDIAAVTTGTAPVRTDPVEHDVHTDAVQIGDRIGDRASHRLGDMQPDFLDDVLGLRDATRPPGEEPDELRAMCREHRRQAGRLKGVGVGYGLAPKVMRRVLPAARWEVASEMSRGLGD